jgi:hypothetical protein
MALNKLISPALNINLIGIILWMLLTNFDHFLDLELRRWALSFLTYCSRACLSLL